MTPPPDVTSVFALRDWLGRDDPALRDALCAPTVRIAVNDELVLADAPLSAEDEIAFMPPVSGG
jgi:molybdopterin synthase sulfur carrier subunit